MVEQLTVEERISKAIIAMQGSVDKSKQTGSEQPFFAQLIMAMRFSKMPPNFPMQSIGVDPKGNCMYSEGFVQGLTKEQLRGVLVHEVMHLVCLHHSRRGSRNKDLANIAQDIVVNMMVKKAGLKLPSGCIDPNTSDDTCTLPPINGVVVKVSNVSDRLWEDIYNELMQKIPPSPSGGGGSGGDGVSGDDGGQGGTRGDGPYGEGKGRLDTHFDGDDMTPEEIEKAEREWTDNLIDAATRAKQRGELPVGMKRLIDELLQPRLPWKSLLLKYLRPHLMPVDWSYHKPHKKSYQLDVFLPVTLKEGVEVEVIVDTSGSINKDDLRDFLSEIVGIATSMQHVTMHVTFVDAAVHKKYRVDNGDIPKILAMEISGGGGTKMEVGLDEIKKNNPQVSVVIVMTDGVDSYDRKRTDYPFEVIWCIQKNGSDEQPYGLKVRM